MDKFFGFFTKNRKKDETFCEIPLDSVPTQVYRNYEFDSENSLIRRSADTFISGKYQNGNKANAKHSFMYTFGKVKVDETEMLKHLIFITKLHIDFERKLKNGLNLSEDGSNSKVAYSDLKNAYVDVKISNVQKISSVEKVEKSRKNVCVINIKNCKYFHVGPQKTINVTKNGGSSEEDRSWPIDLKLLDCYQKISEESIMVISLHMGNNWKKFGTSLGLKDNYLEELKSRNDENAIFMTFDMLQKYITLFPNTSVGFIVNILNELHERKIVREIAKIIKT